MQWTPFEGGMGKSIIDVTMVTSRFSDRITNWKVSNTDMRSDHNLIEFDIEMQAPETITYTDYANGDHEGFKKACEEDAAKMALDLMLIENNIDKVEKRCKMVTESIQANAKKYFKVKEILVRPNNSKWITKEVLKQINVCSRARGKFRKNPVFIKHNYDLWKKEEKKLTDMVKGKKRDFERGKAKPTNTRTQWHQRILAGTNKTGH